MADDLATTETPDPVQEIKDNALGQIAKSEDITAYVAERQDRQAEETGEDRDTDDRATRIREALKQARADTEQARNGLDPSAQQQPDLDQQYQSAQEQWAQAEAAEQESEAERDQARNEGRFQAVADNLKARDPATWNQITDQMKLVDAMLNEDQSDAFRRAITRGNAAEGMAIAHRLSIPSYHPDGTLNMSAEQKIAHLAGLSPAELESTLDQARTYLQLETQIGQQFAARYAQMPQRHTRAPQPFKAPRGGAAPPRDRETLASKENPKDYIAARQAQMKREER